jgi:acyl-CoA synthetase (AMP-forming)/AMP-acid ligase II
MDVKRRGVARDDASRCQSFMQVLRDRAAQQPDKTAFVFLRDGEVESERITYLELDRRARGIAAHLQQVGLTGERVLLVAQAGIDYIAAFFGCLYARAVAIPAYPPGANMHASRLQKVLADAQASTVLTTAVQIQTLRARLGDDLQFIAADGLSPGVEDSWQPPALDLRLDR